MGDYIPFGKRVLIKVTEKEEKTASGIYIPQSNQKFENTGIVIKCGSQCELGIIEGDKVMFDAYKHTPIKIDEKDYVICLESDIFIKYPV